MNAGRFLYYLAVAGAGAIGLCMSIWAGGILVGHLLPEPTRFACSARFTQPRDVVWRRLGLPEERVEQRRRADGLEAAPAPGDTTAPLRSLYQPMTLGVHHHAGTNFEYWVVTTFADEGGGTRVRVEALGRFKAGWHRVLFWRFLRQDLCLDLLRRYAKQLGEPGATIRKEPVSERLELPR